MILALLLMENLGKLGLDLTSLLFYLINFGVIVFVLAKWVYKPLMNFLDERSKVIEKNLKEAESLKIEFTERLQKKEEERNLEETALHKEIAEIKETAKAEARKIIAEGEAEKHRIVEQAKLQAGILQKQLEEKIEDELLEKVTALVEEAIRHSLDPEDAGRSVKKAWKNLKQR